MVGVDTGLDHRLRAVRDEAREQATDLRTRALAIDAAPDRMDPHLDSPVLQAIRRMDPVRDGCLASAVRLVELASGDAGAVLAAPGPALAGVLVRMAGSAEQNDRLDAALADGRSWGFLAITEPEAGSDATRLRTELQPDGDGFRLHGTKRYIGNGARGRIGVVLARTGPNPLSLRAALVDATGPRCRAHPLDMVGLRGARISELVFDGLAVSPGDLLGQHLSPVRRGMAVVMQAFNLIRVQVAAMAVGTAQAIHDYVRAERGRGSRVGESTLDDARGQVDAARDLTLLAAREVDLNPRNGYPASVAKLTATDLARRLSRELPRVLGRGALLEHPLLEKWWRDIGAFEYMEGTSTVQRLHIAHGYLARVGVTPGEPS